MGPRESQKTVIDSPAAFAAAFAVSRETVERLETYAALLARWQKSHNLVAPKTLDEVWHRHFADSAQTLALMPGARRWLDLGSGGGFPGMVIAIMLMERDGGGRVDLVEATTRKCAFLDAVRRETGAPARIHNMRIEDAPARLPGAHDAVTARALAPLDRLLRLAAPFLEGTGGHAQGLFLKGQDVASELTAASRYWKIVHELHGSLTEPGGRILMVKALESVPARRREPGSGGQ